MKIYNSIVSSLRIAVFMVSLLIITSCQEEEVEIRDKNGLPLISVLNSMESDGRFSIFFGAMRELGVVPLYNGSGPRYDYTIFAPTNEAFEAFFARYDTYDEVVDIPDALLFDLVEYHIVEGTLRSADLGNAQTTVQGTDITFANNMVNGVANIIETDRVARNGVVHEIDAVLIPPTIGQETILEIASDPNFSTLAAALGRFPDLVDLVDGGNGAFTVFAPTNDAFAQLLSTLPYASLDEVPDPLLRVILEYHVLDAVLESDEVTGPQLTSGGETLNLNEEALGNLVTSADIGATNGVVHVVNSVLQPPSLGTIVGTILTTPRFSTLAEALVKVDLTTPVSLGEVTLFAPNNDAFTAAGITDLQAVSDEDLTSILTYHVADAVLPSDVIEEGFAQTLNGAFVDISVDMNVMIDQSLVVSTDLGPDNAEGVLHEIGSVLSPPANTIAELAQNTPSLSTLVAALERANLTEELNTAGPFTVFAPDNNAFDALLASLGFTSLDEIPITQLVPILRYHVVPGRIVSDILPNGNVETLNNSETININNRVFTIDTGGDQNIDLTTGTLDIQANNGVVHIVNTVLLP